MVKATIIIPTMGGQRDYLVEALHSIEQQRLPRDEFEIIVVDNNSKVTLAEEVERFNRDKPHPIRYLHEPRVGSTEARHAGARAACGEILVYTDDDVLVSPDWLKSLLEPFRNPQVGCVGGKTIAKWECPVPEWFPELRKVTMGMLDLGNKTLEINWCQLWSNNLAVRRSVLFQVGGFHPDMCGKGANKLFWYGGDGECGLEQKILDHGYKLVYEPRAWIRHRVPASRATKAYICERSYFSAVTTSFAEVRRMKGVPLGPMWILIHSARCIIKAMAFLLASYIFPRNRMNRRAFAYHYFGKANHKFRAVFNGNLRRNIFRESYLEESSGGSFGDCSRSKQEMSAR